MKARRHSAVKQRPATRLAKINADTKLDGLQKREEHSAEESLLDFVYRLRASRRALENRGNQLSSTHDPGSG